ncbi:caspase family protein [Novosphingobium colocasiae]
MDGDRVASALNAAGFADAGAEGAVQVRRDLNLEQMTAAIAAFKAKLAAAGPDAFGVLYYSGHGAALSTYGDVMMLPVDAGRTLDTGTTSLTRAALTKALLGSGAKNVLIILDMCRNVLVEPPLQPVVPPPGGETARPEAAAAGEIGPDGTKGLRRLVRQSDVQLRPDQGYLVAFSTSADQFAFDNGVFLAHPGGGNAPAAAEHRRCAQAHVGPGRAGGDEIGSQFPEAHVRLWPAGRAALLRQLQRRGQRPLL